MSDQDKISRAQKLEKLKARRNSQLSELQSSDPKKMSETVQPKQEQHINILQSTPLPLKPSLPEVILYEYEEQIPPLASVKPLEKQNSSFTEPVPQPELNRTTPTLAVSPVQPNSQQLKESLTEIRQLKLLNGQKTRQIANMQKQLDEQLEQLSNTQKQLELAQASNQQDIQRTCEAQISELKQRHSIELQQKDTIIKQLQLEIITLKDQNEKLKPTKTLEPLKIPELKETNEQLRKQLSSSIVSSPLARGTDFGVNKTIEKQKQEIETLKKKLNQQNDKQSICELAINSPSSISTRNVTQAELQTLINTIRAQKAEIKKLKEGEQNTNVKEIKELKQKITELQQANLPSISELTTQNSKLLLQLTSKHSLEESLTQSELMHVKGENEQLKMSQTEAKILKIELKKERDKYNKLLEMYAKK
ncbi:Hypothetical_protein [Hexamita inflata]|uniref:Hypothetical_protein n=1 Tax=Hexamita inflata TaxID=28002 RepID=A0ABP1GHK6_9EUKA